MDTQPCWINPSCRRAAGTLLRGVDGGRIIVVSQLWVVWRQDENGTRHLVARGLSEAAARSSVAELEGGYPHKQTYWAAPEHEVMARTRQ